MSDIEDLNSEDREDLEARLYGQVFFSINDSDNQRSTISSVSTSVLDNEKDSQQSTLTDTLPKTSVSQSLCTFSNLNIMTVSKSGELPQKALQTTTCCSTNTVVNQPSLQQTLSRPSPLGSKRTLIHKNRKLQRIFRRKSLPKKLNTHIIILSDDSDDDIKIVNELPQTGDKIISQNDSDNDDIIYVAPPPVPVLTVDTESECEETEDASGDLLLPTPETASSLNQQECNSNDFLDQTRLEAETSALTFNFSLHGTDFSHGTGFVKPANPDVCETESSCSTSDCHRDFNNSLNTIVFNQCEFPRGDIFLENNLDSFSNLITPKRSVNTSQRKKISTKSKGNAQLRANSCNEDASSSSESSSSESDYDNSDTTTILQCNSKLPNLSPMVTETVTSKSIVTKIASPKPHSATKVSKSSKLNKKKTKQKKTKNVEKQQTENELCNTSEQREHDAIDKTTKCVEENSESTVNNDNQDSTNEGAQKSTKSNKRKTKRKKTKTTEEQQIENDACNSLEENEHNAVDNSNSCDQNNCVDENSASTVENDDQNSSNTGIQKLAKSNKKKTKQKKTKNAEKQQMENDAHKSPIENECSAIDSPNNCDDCVEENSTSTAENNDPNATIKGAQKSTDEEMECSLDEIIIVEKPVEVVQVDSTDSEDDCTDLSNVGHNMELANAVQSVAKTNPQTNAVNEFSSDFNLNTILGRMSDEPDKWKVSARDRLGPKPVKQKGPRCRVCREFGHYAGKCPVKPGLPSCSLCGNIGHQEPRCPNKVCFQCANPGSYSTPFCWKCVKQKRETCTICRTIGHSALTCPDTWRRYHMTCDVGPMQKPRQSQLRPRNEQWCSGCAQQGHLEHECDSYWYTRRYPAVAPYIHHYEDLYDMENTESQSQTLTTSDNIYQSNSEVSNIEAFDNTYREFNRNSHFVPNPCSTQSSFEQNSFNPPDLSAVNMDIVPEVQDSLNINNNKQTWTKNEVLNPFALETKRMLARTHNIFINSNGDALRNYIRRHLMRLKTISHDSRTHVEAFSVAQGLMTHVNSKDFKEICQTMSNIFQLTNMFIFGHRKLSRGKRYVELLKSFVYSKDKQVSKAKRVVLENAFIYIFGKKLHNGINYYKLLRLPKKPLQRRRPKKRARIQQ